MGKAILYCFQCTTRLREDDFASGKAVRVGDHVACAACAPAAAPAPAPKKQVTSTRIPAPRPGSSSAAVRPAAPEPARPSRKILVGAGAGALALVLAVAAVFIFRAAPPPPASRTIEAPEPAAPRPTPPPPAAAAADRGALDAARRFAKEHPQDLSGQLREYQNIVLEFDRTESAAEAQKEITRLKTEIRGHVDAAIAALESEIRPLLDRKDYSAALKQIEAAGRRLPYPDWELARSKREHEIRDLIPSKADVPAPPKPPEEKKPVPPAPPSAEAKAWAARWTAAMARATARQHAAAAADLLQGAGALKDETLRMEAAQDIADLKAVQGLASATTEALARRPVGSTLSIALREGRSAAGRILQIGPERVELAPGAGKESVFVEWSDVPPATLAALRRDRAEPRILAIFCLLEGDVETARSVAAGEASAVAPRFWTYGEAAKPAGPAASEAAARELYYAAERKFRSMATRGAAVEKYAALQRDHAATGLVQIAADRIRRRSEAGREYYFSPADFAFGGTIRPVKEGRLESRADSDPSQTLLNFAELEFHALPGTAYRCWILAGGCCQDAFTFYWQGTELREVDPKTKHKVAVEPGAPLAAPVKHALKGLKPHAGKEPKTPSRWEWIEIPLPRYAAAGLKKARFATDQQGFAIAAAVVSASRAKPPSEAEAVELEKTQAVDRPPRSVDPDLVGHWTFDEGSGTEAQDSSGNGHTGRLLGGAGWAPGQIGSGLRCDGTGGFVLLPNTPALDRLQAESFTLAAWYKPDVVPPGAPDANDSAHGIIIKQGWHEGLVFNREGKFIVEHWLTGDAKATGGTWDETFTPGRFYHFAGVIDRPQGKTLVYIDGKLRNTTSWSPGTATKDFASQPWRIGIGAPNVAKWSYPAAGVIDDVRMYRRALSAEEVQSIYEAGR